AMKINYDFIADFLNDPGDYVTVHARVFRKNGQPARKKNGEAIYHSVVFNPAYRSTKYSDMWITMPNANISQGAGKVDYYVTLTFTDKNGKLLPLNGSNRCDFYMTRR
ncbi:MAG: hypothetical protein K2H18_04625, partial [Muribaculaceae bacterium]|nr:hypothetical protein [Muribaculaceae bacterium]